MRVLITGAAGFIGSHLADRLFADGHRVLGVDNYTTGNNEGKWFCWTGDITERGEFYDHANLFRPELIIHCAASYSDPSLWHRDAETNVLGTINATLAAKHHGARLVYFQTALPPISSYAISKIAGEQYIALSGVPSLIFRLANIYGPRNLSGPIPSFYRRLANGQPCTVAHTERDVVFIDDLVNLVVGAIDSGKTGKFDVCSGQHRPIIEFYNAVAEHFDPTGGPVQVAAGEDDVANMQLDPAAAALAFNWFATTDLKDGVRRAVDWYRENGVGDVYTHLALKG